MILRFFRNVFRFFDRSMADNIGLYAAQASFFIVFSAVPFLMLLITLVRYVIPVDITLLLNTLNSYLPVQLYEFVSEIVLDVYHKSTSTGLISATAITTLWLASKGIMALYQGLNMVFSPDSQTNYFRSRAASVLYTLIFIVALFVTIVVFGFGNSIAALIPEHMQIFVKITKTVTQWKIIIFPLLTLIFALFYKILPQEKNSLKKQLPGAAMAAMGWLMFSYIYSIYVKYFSNYSYVYGSLAAIVLLMLWLYICMNIFLLGAQFNQLWNEGFFKQAGETGKTK
ncbi:MAG: YihY/virulence factor BrkB family protein [Clostridiales bacterium]|nr:YihY/virulence factor BrkB family protein [Clostridiales bacterium]